jgi:uncharacterized membrane protein
MMSEEFLMALQLFAVLALGLMCGSELSIAALGHPALNRLPLGPHISARASLARLAGRVMPFWMSASTLLTLLLLLPFAGLGIQSRHFAEVALVLQVAAVAFSLVGPVPINNRILKWTPESLPKDWKSLEHRWDVYHWLRTAELIVAFGFLALSLAVR